MGPSAGLLVGGGGLELGLRLGKWVLFGRGYGLGLRRRRCRASLRDRLGAWGRRGRRSACLRFHVICQVGVNMKLRANISPSALALIAICVNSRGSDCRFGLTTSKHGRTGLSFLLQMSVVLRLLTGCIGLALEHRWPRVDSIPARPALL